MKYLILLLFVLPFTTSAQDSCKLKRTRDAYTKEVRISSGFFDTDLARISVDADKSEIDIFFSLAGGESKCFDDNSTAVVHFANSRLKSSFKNTGTMNCEGYFHFNFRNTASTSYSLQRLVNQKIGSIVFTSGKTVTTITLNEEQQQVFQTALACVSNEAKTLLPQ